ncbi:hypothetical protein FRZ67_16640 [Panacibacter ginsenosidivorans]|uniref:DUF445 family protein n=1 Tax=Panacibacter ginsenosidivorans TaxID=1813871 RepID=A0A5B8VBP8_9BACT|nr:hypothetical protein [Panacibacter ginsenosidivorans]QEC68854.1 hypothetical protein FRZ67_16640 [Panacibacter ginsenosidivorans]
MNNTLLLVPFVAALLSWLMIKFAVRSIFRPFKVINIAGIRWRGLLPKVKEGMTVSIAHAVNIEILNSSFINEKLTGPETLEKAMPAIEAHIDNFLDHKLKEAIPVISMFIGEKITNQLKELFLEELKELFPSVMSQFIGNLSQSSELEKEIVLKLQSVSIEKTEALFYKNFRKTIRRIEVVFAISGLLAGIIQLVLTLLVLSVV